MIKQPLFEPYDGKIEDIFSLDGKYTFLVGAGISMDPPTNLLSAWQIIKILLELFTPEDIELSDRSLEKLGYEAAVELIQLSFDKDLQFMDYFDLIKAPNLIHLMLAYAISTGHYVVTTNFDYMIERALMQILPEEHHNDIIPVITKEDFLSYHEPEKLLKTGKYPIYKIHGSKRNIITNNDTHESLITTTSALGRERAEGETFAIEVYKKPTVYNLMNRRTLVVMGYSGSDDFDIGPTLKELPFLTRVIWVDHTQDNQIEISRVKAHPDLKNDKSFHGIEQLLSEIGSTGDYEVFYIKAKTGELVKNILWHIFVPNIPVKNIDLQIDTDDQIPTFKEYITSLQIYSDEILKYLVASRFYLNLIQIEEAKRYAKKGLALAKSHNDLDMEIIFLGQLGFGYRAEHNDTKALESFEESLRISKNMRDFSRTAAILAHIGRIYNYWGKKDTALEKFEESLKINKENNVDRIICLHEIGRILESREKDDEALERYQEALSITGEIGDLFGKADMLDNIGYIHLKRGSLETALENFEAALHIDTNLNNEPGVGARHYNIAGVYRMQRDYPMALQHYETAFKIAKKYRDLRSMANRLDCIGNVYYEMEEHDQALELLEECLQICEKIPFPVLDIQANCINTIGRIYNFRQEYNIALEKYEEAREIAEKLGRMKQKAVLFNNSGVIYWKQGHYEKALEYYDKALKIYVEIEELSSEDISLIMDIYLNKGEIYQKTENYEKTVENFTKVLTDYEKIR
ncbi:MAG: tetratricopeptide repeat protein, partial [Candidatus Hodarchaeota archaeon]